MTFPERNNFFLNINTLTDLENKNPSETQDELDFLKLWSRSLLTGERTRAHSLRIPLIPAALPIVLWVVCFASEFSGFLAI